MMNFPIHFEMIDNRPAPTAIPLATTQRPIFTSDKAGNHGYALWLNPETKALHTFVPADAALAVLLISELSAAHPHLTFKLHVMQVL